ncbi:Extracellular Matrix protein PelG [hydrothermal vent metagenome]|uniref:Extracellular Matrix protein PelG n=1 Tax=hydrothermal vent metagenome TaxID=652676 RepID=A0A1W1BJ25_9ZZZZ
MAGIGFELRKVLKEDRLLSLAKIYGYSAILSSGSWVISILAIAAIGLMNISNFGEVSGAFKFQVLVTYSIALASNLVLTGILQLPFTRYIADLIFKQKEDEVLPTYFGAIFLSWFLGLLFAVPFYMWVFDGMGATLIIASVATFLILTSIWISSILAASLKYYNEVVWSYLGVYIFIMIFSYLAGNNMEALLIIFFFGNAILFIILATFIIKTYRFTFFLKIDFILAPNFYWTLAFAGLFYNLGAWIDKVIFWYHPATGHAVIGKLHASVVYDMPIFLAYLSILPAMAVFFYRLESDFAENYELYYDSVRNGGTLHAIKKYRKNMVEVIRHAIHEILAIQGIIDIILFLTAPSVFDLLHIPQLYLGLLYILTIGALLQVAFMSVLAILYYLDRKKVAMWLCILFFFSNALFSYISIWMGPSYFGYGYTLSLLLVFILSILIIRDEMIRLNYETFMLQ